MLFDEIIKSWKLPIIFSKSSILDISMGYGYAFDAGLSMIKEWKVS